MNFAEILGMLGGNAWFYGGSFILVLSILVFVHEFGHYIIARACGVRVETFSLGFGKEICGFHDKNGTRWKLSLIPLGGYVKLYGDVDPASAGSTDIVEGSEGEPARPMTAEERKQAFFAQNVWKRAAVVVAGPAINYIFAMIILTLLFTFNGQPITPPSAAAIIVDSSAAQNGFLPHDKILSVDGKPISTFEDIRREMMIALDQKKHFIVERDGQTMDIYAAPKLLEQQDRFGFKHSIGILGLISPRHAVDIKNIKAIDGKPYADVEEIRKVLLSKMDQSFVLEVKEDAKPSDDSVEQTPEDKKPDLLLVQPMSAFNASLLHPETVEKEKEADKDILFLADVEANVFVKYPLLKSIAAAANECWVVTRGTVEALGQMVTGTRSASELGGIIRIGTLAGDMAKQGVIALIMFTALLSINLGLINLFPIPMLDGGHLVFYAFEAALGRPVPEHIQEYAFRIGMAFLVGVMVFANLSDVVQLLL